jgi:hypothetical protein
MIGRSQPHPPLDWTTTDGEIQFCPSRHWFLAEVDRNPAILVVEHGDELEPGRARRSSDATPLRSRTKPPAEVS